MYAYVKTSKRKVKSHLELDIFSDKTGILPWIERYKTIKANEPYVQVSNGTIGKGARYINISKSKLIELLKQLDEKRG